MFVFKCPYTPEAHKFGVSREFLKLKEKLQGIKGSGFMRDVRCVLAHPTLMNCFIESYGLNFVPEDLKRDTVRNAGHNGRRRQPGRCDEARASHTVR